MKINKKELLQAIETAVEMNNNGDYGIPVPDYVDENAPLLFMNFYPCTIGFHLRKW